MPAPVKQRDHALLDHPFSQELLTSTIPARLANVRTDGIPALCCRLHISRDVLLGAGAFSKQNRTIKSRKR